jgi:hypothetical protein
MSTVFISYRRQTAAGEARALFNDLVARLGQGAVFMDVDSISLGRDFRGELQKTLAACDLMLVIIDKEWAAAKDERGRVRLENAGDFVRMEIEAALKRDIAVTPVLVKGAQMPAAEELPAEIRDLAYRNGFELAHNRWESDVQEMIRRLRLDVLEQGGQVKADRRPKAPAELGGGSGAAAAVPRLDRQGPGQATEDHRGLTLPTARQLRMPLVIAGVLGVVCLIGAGAWLAIVKPETSRHQATTSPPVQTPDPNFYYRLSTQFGGADMSLDVFDGGAKNNMTHLERFQDVSGQYWKFLPTGDGSYRLTALLRGSGVCLDIFDGGPDNNQPHLAPCANVPGQFWNIRAEDGWVRLTTKLRGGGMCLDINPDNNQPYLAPCANFSGQFWLLSQTDQR